ncbi:hypothetical protein CI109_103219 [Kwoniella shandongensis]|uniref:Uncharacterized protein n=1 Tax=Kwoniella shandongensis TaxID=1734106 RepID=A0A5M6C8S4_9TREE|nr:uncharacterized protein CI109_000409 [Kwoniella shandongensis]KAA5531566.1 hypothetical protein CI109_000409 [Kwoniella shandongensis]
MNPRTLFASGPSRLRPLITPSLLTPTRRYLLTFPHPDLDPSKGSTKLVIKTFNNIPSILHAYAIIRAVESKLGASILDMYLPKDPDSFNPGPTIFLTTLRPVKLDKPLLLEIPPPTISSESNFLGGPSLRDLETILNPENGSSLSVTTELTRNPSGKKDEQPLQFRVEVQKNVQSRREREMNGTISKNAKKNRRVKFRNEGKEAAEIVKELRNFGGGFYGGFEGLADKFEKLLSKSSSDRGDAGARAESRASGVAAEESEEAAVDVKEVKEDFEPLSTENNGSKQQ